MWSFCVLNRFSLMPFGSCDLICVYAESLLNFVFSYFLHLLIKWELVVWEDAMQLVRSASLLFGSEIGFAIHK